MDCFCGQNISSNKQQKRCCDEESGQVAKCLRYCSFQAAGDSSCAQNLLCCQGRCYECRSMPAAQSDLHIHDLPEIVLLSVMKLLPLTDLLCRASLVCKYWLDLAHSAPLWRSIRVKGCEVKVDDAVLSRLYGYSKYSCTHIDASDMTNITVHGVRAATERCKQLQALLLVRCLHLPEEAFLAVGQNCKQLQILGLDSCLELTDEALITIAAGCPKLRCLFINYCTKLTSRGVRSLSSCKDLKTLSMDRCKNVDDSCLEELANGCSNLQMFSCAGCSFSAAGLRHLTKFRQLKWLGISDVPIVNRDCLMQVVQHCPDLEGLNVSLCTDVTDDCVEYIAEYAKKLKNLSMISCPVTDTGLFSLGKHRRQMEQIDVSWCQGITDEGALGICDLCPNLVYLGLMRCDKVTVATSESLVERFPQLSVSTWWLECKQLLTKAKRRGFLTDISLFHPPLWSGR